MASARKISNIAALVWGMFVAYGCAVASDGTDGSDCSIGSEGCECTGGGGCDPPLQCLSGFCVDAGGGGGESGTSSSQGGGLTVATNGATNASTGVTSSSVASTGATTASTTIASSSSTGGGSCAVPDPALANGCTTCGACDVWTVNWQPVAQATHYRVAFQCAGMHESPDITDTDAELCEEVGMCDYCSGVIGGIYVKACDSTCCSPGVLVPVSEAPLNCWVDCCL